jgi:hypothetical protein
VVLDRLLGAAGLEINLLFRRVRTDVLTARAALVGQERVVAAGVEDDQLDMRNPAAGAKRRPSKRMGAQCGPTKGRPATAAHHMTGIHFHSACYPRRRTLACHWYTICQKKKWASKPTAR